MHRKKTPDTKDFDNNSDHKGASRKKLKQFQDEHLKDNMYSDDDDENSSVQAKGRSAQEKSDNKGSKSTSTSKITNTTIGGNKSNGTSEFINEEDAVDGNDDECYLCEEGGSIICCDNCSRSFHFKCIGLKNEPEGDWSCKYCLALKESTLNICKNCNKSLKDAALYERLTCSKCLRNIHLDCCEVPLSLIIDCSLNKNFIFDPSTVKELKQNLFKHAAEPEEILEKLYDKHKYDYLFYICNGCISDFGFGKIRNNCKQKVYLLKKTKKKFQDQPVEFYLVKLKRCSDLHTFWVQEDTLRSTNPALLRHFRKPFDEGIESWEPAENEEDMLGGDSESFRVEKILACKKPLASRKKSYGAILEDINALVPKSKNLMNNYNFLIKWEDLEYKHATWEDQFVIVRFKDKVNRYLELCKKKPAATSVKKSMAIETQKLIKYTSEPHYLEGKLFEHQLEGFNWLISQYLQKNNAILADEMGLGKTIQTLCFLKYLSIELNIEGPFLIVAPASTIYNWQREASKWCSNLETIIYSGDVNSRNKIREYEFYKKKSKKGFMRPRFHIAITTYTFVNQDVNFLKQIEWEAIVVDEAQRLKNSECKLYKLCGNLETKFKLLLTGTPIQNSIEELASLVNYIMPANSKIKEEIGDLTSTLAVRQPGSLGKKEAASEAEKEASLKKLKTILKKHMLRRTVQDANLKFPELEEKIVKLNLSNVQKHVYKNILTKNYNVLSNAEVALGKQAKTSKRSSENLRVSLINILMHLRLVCDHPDLFYSRSVTLETDAKKFESEVVESSNKLKFLDRVIPRLLNHGHKILIFTQFVLMLDIIEEFLIFKGLEYERLDGTTRNADRQRIIDSFNNGKSKIFILSTRAGGLGINLTSSDTVIFVDSDFNPYRDIQAFCRAYRIGQKNKVMVYRLVSKYTVEEKIVENATKKLMLGEMIINPVDQSKADKGVIDSILRHGAMELFDKTVDQENEDEITEDKLEELLHRGEQKGNMVSEEDEKKKQQHKVSDLNDFYLSGFNFIDFSFTPIIPNTSIEETKENKYWETILSDAHNDSAKNMEDDYGKGKRNKRMPPPQLVNGNPDSSESIDIQIPLVLTTSEESGSSREDSDYEVGDNTVKRKGRIEYSSDEDEEKISLPEHLLMYLTQLSPFYDEIRDKSGPELEKICPLDEQNRIAFLEFALKFGIPSIKVDDMYKQYIKNFRINNQIYNEL